MERGVLLPREHIVGSRRVGFYIVRIYGAWAIHSPLPVFDVRRQVVGSHWVHVRRGAAYTVPSY
jgi:hypothetical protein